MNHEQPARQKPFSLLGYRKPKIEGHSRYCERAFKVAEMSCIQFEQPKKIVSMNDDYQALLGALVAETRGFRYADDCL
jgi:hypothetical protein